MKNKYLFKILSLATTFFIVAANAQVGIGNISPTSTLDITAINPTGTTSNVDGILIPRVDRQRAGSMLAIPNGTMIFVNSIATGAATGINSNIIATGFYAFDTSLLPAPGKWIQFQTTSADWSTTGNAGTTPATNFLGTTDATNLILKTNSLQRLKIDNSTNATTGTTGDIEIGDANSGTIRANKEMVIRMDGDDGGGSILRLRNRFAQNGAVFETTGGNYLVDFIFKTGPLASRIQSNIRFETRGGSPKIGTNTTEWQFGQPDSTNGGPTLVVGGSGLGSNSAFRIGNVGFGGNIAPAANIHNNGTTAFTTATSGTTQTILLLDGGTFTAPAAITANNGLVYIIRNTSTSLTTTVNTIIDYNNTTATNFSLTPAIGSIMIVSNGTSWYRIH